MEGPHRAGAGLGVGGFPAEGVPLGRRACPRSVLFAPGNHHFHKANYLAGMTVGFLGIGILAPDRFERESSSLNTSLRTAPLLVPETRALSSTCPS